MMTRSPETRAIPKRRYWLGFFMYSSLNVGLLVIFAAAARFTDPPPVRPDRVVAIEFMDGLRFGSVEDDAGQTGYDQSSRLMSEGFRSSGGVVRLVEEMDDIVASRGLIVSCKLREREYGNHVYRQIVFDVECARDEGDTKPLMATVFLVGADDAYLVEGLTWSFEP